MVLNCMLDLCCSVLCLGSVIYSTGCSQKHPLWSSCITARKLNKFEGKFQQENADTIH